MSICTHCSQEFEVSSKEAALCRRLGLPLPTLCRSERMRQVMATRNEWKLYRRKCDKTGKEIISAYHADSPFTVYSNKEWWGDNWNALDYGREYDFSRPFFEQFAELQKAVPREGTSVFNSENCEFNSHIRESRNSYMNSLVFKCEDLYYSYWMVNDKDVSDSMYTNDSTLCFYCISVNNSYGCFALDESVDCNECFFSYQLRGCRNCIFCSNLANKEYYAFNKKCSKEEFGTLKTRYLDGTHESWQKGWAAFLKIRSEAPQRFVHNLNCENVEGDHCYNCRNCEDVFESFDAEDCVNSVSMANSKDVHNTYSAGWTACEVGYNSAVIRGCKFFAFCTYTWFSSEMRYCDSCVSCNNCFGCIGLRHKDYCILNKQYSREEYQRFLPRVIKHMELTSAVAGQAGEWGQFFPKQNFFYAYNESAAQDFFPLKKEEALKAGYQWFDYEAPIPKVDKIIPASRLPDNIKDTPDDILNWAIECEVTGRPFLLIDRELRFYRENNLPIPRKHPDQRHKERMALRNPLMLFDRQCSECGSSIKSSYPPDSKELVYCEACYLKSVD